MVPLLPAELQAKLAMVRPPAQLIEQLESLFVLLSLTSPPTLLSSAPVTLPVANATPITPLFLPTSPPPAPPVPTTTAPLAQVKPAAQTDPSDGAVRLTAAEVRTSEVVRLASKLRFVPIVPKFCPTSPPALIESHEPEQSPRLELTAAVAVTFPLARELVMSEPNSFHPARPLSVTLTPLLLTAPVAKELETVPLDTRYPSVWYNSSPFCPISPPSALLLPPLIRPPALEFEIVEP